MYRREVRREKAIKVKLGAGDVEGDMAIVADVRRTIGDGVRLMFDFNHNERHLQKVLAEYVGYFNCWHPQGMRSLWSGGSSKAYVGRAAT